MSQINQTNQTNPIIISIAGGTGAGKTTLANLIAEKLNPIEVVIIQQDSYYKDRSYLPEEERGSVNYDHPSAFESELLIEHLKRLKQNLSIEKPIYDFTTHTRKNETETIHPARIIVLEVILILENKDLRDLMDIKVFVDTVPDVRFIRRLQRDIEDRGRSLESIIKQYLETVRPMHLEFVEKSQQYADIIISGESDSQQARNTTVAQIKLMLNKDLE